MTGWSESSPGGDNAVSADGHGKGLSSDRSDTGLEAKGSFGGGCDKSEWEIDGFAGEEDELLGKAL